MDNPRWKHRPPGSNWGDFGPDDQRGRMNLLTPRQVLLGMAEVKTGETFCLSLPLDYPGGNLQWVTDSGVVALIADNYAVESIPARPGRDTCCAGLPLHEHCIFKLGVHLGELWYLTALAERLRAQGRSRFLLTAPPLNLPGAVGSPATPVATL